MPQSIFESNFLTFITGGDCNFWTVNPYTLCDFRCTYCITGVQGHSVPALKPEQETLSILKTALQQLPMELPIVVGGISDAYPTAEIEYGFTREILKLLIAQQRSFSIITKSTLIERDIDLLSDYKNSRVEFSFSTLNDELALQYEKDAPAPSLRLALLKRFLAIGIEVSVSLRPWIPGISDIKAFLREVPDEVSIGLERLKIVRACQTISIAGKTYTQSGVDRQYSEERENYRDCDRLKWSMDERFSNNENTDQHPMEIILKENEQLLQQCRQIASSDF